MTVWRNKSNNSQKTNDPSKGFLLCLNKVLLCLARETRSLLSLLYCLDLDLWYIFMSLNVIYVSFSDMGSAYCNMAESTPRLCHRLRADPSSSCSIVFDAIALSDSECQPCQSLLLVPLHVLWCLCRFAAHVLSLWSQHLKCMLTSTFITNTVHFISIQIIVIQNQVLVYPTILWPFNERLLKYFLWLNPGNWEPG